MNDSPEESEDQIEQIVKQLNSHKKAEREEAERRLREVGPGSVQALLNVLTREQQRRKKSRKIVIGFIIAYIPIMITIAILTHNPGLMGTIGSMSGMTAALVAISHAQKSVTLMLAQLEDMRTVGVLAEALGYQDKEIVKAAETSLIRLLPQLKASNAGLLNAGQRSALDHALGRNNPDLIMAILQGYEQVGDSHAIPAVQKLADGGGIAAMDSRIRATARECLPALVQRSEEERFRQTLLRATAATANTSPPSDMLLRPAGGVNSTDPHELLRSISAQTDVTVTDPATIQINPNIHNNPVPPHTEGREVGEASRQAVPAANSYTQTEEEPAIAAAGRQG